MKASEIFLDEVYANPSKRNDVINKTDLRYIYNIWSMYFLDLNDYCRKTSKGYRYILAVIDNLSNFGWKVPLRNKNSQKIRDL